MIFWDSDHNMLPGVQVSIVNSNAPFNLTSKVDVLAAAAFITSDSSLYFAPTNSFCGPVELRDAQGRRIPTTRPDLALAAEYPPCFGLSFARQHKATSAGAVFPQPLLSWHHQLARFRVSDLFRITENGKYKLTVWPRIYQRAATNVDECCRMDLPPVSVSFEWRGGEAKTRRTDE